MMFVESILEETNPNYITLEVKVESGRFANYLSSRNQRYPSYIQCNTLWYSVLNPYKPYIAAFPEERSQILRINEPISINLPPKFIALYRNKYRDALVQCLLAWLQEEYEQYQDDWHSKANPLSSSVQVDWDASL